MKTKILFCVVLVGVLSACGGGGGSVSEAALAEACNDTVNWTSEGCDCMAEKAKQDLSVKGQQLLYASLTDDAERAEELAKSMTLEEATTAGMFMVNAGMSCAMAQQE